MRGHNYGSECIKCGKIHLHPKGMLGKKNSGPKRPYVRNESYHQTEEFKLKQRLSHLGKKQSAKTKLNLSTKLKALHQTEAYRQKYLDAMKKVVASGHYQRNAKIRQAVLPIHQKEVAQRVQQLSQKGASLIWCDLKGVPRPDVIYFENGYIVWEDLKIAQGKLGSIVREWRFKLRES